MNFMESLKRNKVLYMLFSKTKRKERKRKRALKKDGLQMIKNVEQVFKETEYVCFATCGTLLGIVRDHTFIGWDDDVDYGLMIENEFDWNQFENHLNIHGFKKIRQFKYLGVVREQTYKKGKLTIDFFGHFMEPNGHCYGFGFYKKNGLNYESENMYSIRRVEVPYVSELVKVPFLGVQVSIPKNSGEFLESLYGEDWRTPNPKWNMTSDTRDNITYLDDFGIGELRD